MTEETKKKKPDFYIFEGIEGKDKIIGSVYLHKKGKGFNILMGRKVYKVFPRKEAQQQEEGGA